MTDPAEPHDTGATTSASPTELTAELSIVPAPPVGWSDPLTGADGPRYWDRTISSEQARIRRSKRSATIVLLEFRGLDDLVERWGRDAAEGMFVKLARTLGREVRTSDYLARVERTQFAILLTETDEIAAINFVDRVRSACEAELSMARESLRIGIGWASPSVAGDLSTALEVAAKRLVADLERPA
jgi:diguanylate cyclase (GGDEF)-like protein